MVLWVGSPIASDHRSNCSSHQTVKTPPLALVHWQDWHTHWLRRAADSTLTSCRSSLSLFGLQPLPELGAASYCAVPGRFVGPFFFSLIFFRSHTLLAHLISFPLRSSRLLFSSLSSSHSCSSQSPPILRDPLRPKHREGIATPGALQSVGSRRIPCSTNRFVVDGACIRPAVY